MQEDSKNIINLVDEEGRAIKLETLATIETDDGNRYVVLMPIEDGQEEDTDEVVIMQVTSEQEESVYLPVEDEELLDQIFEAFQKECK